MTMRICFFHADEGVHGVPTGETGMLTYTCPRTKGHPTPGPYTWLDTISVPEVEGMGGLAGELGLAVELPSSLAPYKGRWVEYGVVEHAYAQANPDDFNSLVQRFGHTAIAPRAYTASSYLAGILGGLGRTGDVLYHEGPGTGRWNYLSKVSWWALAPGPDWAERTSWADTGLGMDYVPGNQES